MKKTIEYRKHAQECRAMAQNARNAEERGQLMKMAEAWDRFAVERERGLHDDKGYGRPGADPGEGRASDSDRNAEDRACVVVWNGRRVEASVGEDKFKAERYRRCAEEILAAAERLTDPMQRALLQIAADYHKLTVALEGRHGDETPRRE